MLLQAVHANPPIQKRVNQILMFRHPELATHDAEIARAQRQCDGLGPSSLALVELSDLGAFPPVPVRKISSASRSSSRLTARLSAPVNSMTVRRVIPPVRRDVPPGDLTVLDHEDVLASAFDHQTGFIGEQGFGQRWPRAWPSVN